MFCQCCLKQILNQFPPLPHFPLIPPVILSAACYVFCSARYHEGVSHALLHKELGKQKSSVGPEVFWLARRYHMGKSPVVTFHSHNFRAVITYILHANNHAKYR